MLLKELLESPKTSSSLLVSDPFREPDQVELVREVIGLANADVDGPRNILFGVKPGAEAGDGIVGIDDSAMAELKKAHRLISALIEPVIHLAFIFDRINGKLVGTLEIDGCDEGPYFVGLDHTEALARGQSWIREGWALRPLEASELAEIRVPEVAEDSDLPAKPISLDVGFDGEPSCKVLDLAVPDTSDPPFARDKDSVAEPRGIKQAIKDTIETVTTQMLRLRRIPEQETVDTEIFRESQTIFADAENHYFFEEKALQLNLAVCNTGEEDIKDVSIELGFPRILDFDVADRLYISPFDKRTPHELKNLGYPNVERHDDSIVVRSPLVPISPGSTEPAFRCALRMAVGPAMQGRKVAIHYTLRGKDNQKVGKGRLKIIFGPIAA